MAGGAPRAADEARLIRVSGVVQGVGFRPFVARLAARLGVAGWVRNDLSGVVILARARAEALDAFERALRTDAPPAARVASLDSAPADAKPQPSAEGDAFAIVESEGGPGAALTSVPPDLALCADCRRELLDPADRRHGYAFINCTSCGPRYSIVLELPYDRPQTTMRTFPMCPQCRAEYENPRDRRYHAQPNACPACGPSLRLLGADGFLLAEGAEAFEACARLIGEGRIAAVKGVGGFHLLVDARNDAAVRELRRRKLREEKPFAVMFPSLESLRSHAETTPEAEALLESPAAPIVLVRRREASDLSPSLAPGNPCLGALLPYSPVHALLLRRLGRPVVATSGNLSEEPLCIDDAEALLRLKGIADVFLVSNRPIARPVDDSVLRLASSGPVALRRARGLAPHALRLPHDAASGETLLCVGGHMKAAVALAAGPTVTLGPHLGDLGSTASMEAFRRGIELLVSLLREHPSRIVCDAHPGYASTRHALESGLPVVRVQHHLAHVLACLAEHEGGPDRVLGVSWDGTGDGCDGTVWGGEFILVDRRARTAARVASLRPFRLPGGEAAVREPRRAAVGLLAALHGAEWPGLAGAARSLGFSDTEAAALSSMARSGLRSPVTTSAGRLFDGLAALLRLARVNRFEGQGAMSLEFAAARASADAPVLPFPVRRSEQPGGGSRLEIDWGPAVDLVLRAVPCGSHTLEALALGAHRGLCEAIVSVAREIGCGAVALSGGCFQNVLLLDGAGTALREAGFEVLIHRELPPNDGNLAVGQALGARWGLTEVSG